VVTKNMHSAGLPVKAALISHKYGAQEWTHSPQGGISYGRPLSVLKCTHGILAGCKKQAWLVASTFPTRCYPLHSALSGLLVLVLVLWFTTQNRLIHEWTCVMTHCVVYAIYAFQNSPVEEE
jgi:hypothetical protein